MHQSNQTINTPANVATQFDGSSNVSHLDQPDPKKRIAIGKKQRFEVFKRDSFTCQYCGSKAPDVVLHVDHINPVSKGGENEIINLITSCVSCNLGKSDRLLTDKTSIEMQRKQLEELAERRDQLEMMLAWRDSLKGLDDDIVDEVAIRIEDYIPGNTINDHGKSLIRKWLKKYSIEELLDAAEIAEKKLDAGVTPDSVGVFFNSIPNICATKRLPEAKQRLLYARGILRRRVYVNEAQVMKLMEGAVAAGLDVEELIEFTKEVRNWTEFRNEMEAVSNG
ncbi:HNH endonuclease [Pseudomonas gessardii]|uniref:HNH endonuclease n=1 Tax=Pseudomonas gessardii TaxID=78544 RepID=UPI0008904280|nr:HNH endonuclease [Pseudomonas gessardii]MRU54305.1 HNH endonuclease [Pseudomonas gessardii]SDR41158.1 HNH endonuclease [Pseudomonas gessardii]